MRKITLNPRIGNTSIIDFENNWIVVKDGDTLTEFKASRKPHPYKNYSVEQIEVILDVNNVLEQNNQPLMTEEEIEGLLYPFGKELEVKLEGLQKLAGFEVKKEVVYK